MLNQHAPQKIKHVSGNQMSFLAKQLSKEIMKKSRLCNGFLRNRTEENKILYNWKGNYFVSFLQNPKTGYYEKLNIKNVTDNKLLPSDKSRIRDRIKICSQCEILKTGYCIKRKHPSIQKLSLNLSYPFPNYHYRRW